MRVLAWNIRTGEAGVDAYKKPFAGSDRYSHAERERPLSDHSVLLVDFAAAEA